MRELTLAVKVQTNSAASEEQIANAIQTLLDVGLADAFDTLEEGEGALEHAQLATDLTIHAPVIAKPPRVLIIVGAGVSDYVADAGVDVAVFDWDNYNDDPDGTEGVSEEFSDLAGRYEIPVRGQASEENAR